MACNGFVTTTIMSLRPPPADSLRRPRVWLVSAALLALTPKCVLCVLAYAGLGAALGLGGPELCGATPSTAGHWFLLLTATAATLVLAALRRRA